MTRSGLMAESVVMIFAAREPGEELKGLPELVVEGLGDHDARELLRSVIPGRLDDRVADQVVAETYGNPLALLELPRGLTPAQLAGGFGLPGAISLEGRIEERFLQRLDALPEDSQRLLLVAAADSSGDPALLWRAARRLGLTGEELQPAKECGLLGGGLRVQFRHPLVRSAVYRAASSEQRRDVHGAVAEATDGAVDPRRRAGPPAGATASPDELVAAELESSAERAQERGGLAAAAAFLERAVVLTPDPSRRADRALAAAQTKVQAGALDTVQNLLATAEAGPLSEVQQARADLVRAQLAFMTSRRSDAAPLLLHAAKRLESIAPGLSRAYYLDALYASSVAGRFAPPDGSLLEVTRAASAARPPGRSADQRLLDGMAATSIEGCAAGLPILRDALGALSDGVPAGEERRWMQLAFIAAVHPWDDDAC